MDVSYSSRPSDVQISVVIPVYNNHRYAARAVCSVLRQTEPVFEVILVDDNSEDQSYKVMLDLLRRCKSKVSLHSERLPKNVGAGLARHRGAQIARGTHVAFLDADDLWHQEKISRVSEVIKRTQAEVVGHRHAWSLDLTKKTLQTSVGKGIGRRLRTVELLARNPISASSVVITAEIARQMYRFGGRRSEDYMALVVAHQQASQSRFIAEPLAFSPKPPIGCSGQGADTIELHRAAVSNMLKLRKEGIVTPTQLLIFLLAVMRAPAGWIRARIYKALYNR